MTMIGAQSVGKSSLINQLMSVFSKKAIRLYRDPFDEDYPEMISKLKKEANEINSQERIMLTTSIFPGTTLKPVKVKIPNCSLSIYDTPGIPLKGQLSSMIDSPSLLKETAFIKKPSVIKTLLKGGYSLWLGALIRIDLRSVVLLEK